MSLLSIFYNTVTNVKGRIAEIFYDTSSKTLSTPNIQIEPTGVSTVGELRLKELASNGTNYAGFKSPDSLSSDLIFQLPAADGTSGQVLKTNGSKVLSFVDPASIAATRDDFTSSGQTVFTASASMTGKTVIVMHNGLTKREGSGYDYTISGTTLTFTYTIPSTHWVTIIIIG